MPVRHQHLQVVDARLLGMFYLAFNDQTIDAILETYDLTRADCVRLLSRLDKLGLIERGVEQIIAVHLHAGAGRRADA